MKKVFLCLLFGMSSVLVYSNKPTRYVQELPTQLHFLQDVPLGNVLYKNGSFLIGSHLKSKSCEVKTEPNTQTGPSPIRIALSVVPFAGAMLFAIGVMSAPSTQASVIALLLAGTFSMLGGLILYAPVSDVPITQNQEAGVTVQPHYWLSPQGITFYETKRLTAVDDQIIEKTIGWDELTTLYSRIDLAQEDSSQKNPSNNFHQTIVLSYGQYQHLKIQPPQGSQITARQLLELIVFYHNLYGGKAEFKHIT